MQKHCLTSGWDQNEIGKLSTLDKICTHPVVKTRIYNAVGLQLFCSSSGSMHTSWFLPWTLQQLISETGGKPKAYANPTHDQIMSQTTYVYDIGIFTHINQYPIYPPLSLSPTKLNNCVSLHTTPKPTGRSHIPTQTKFLTLVFSRSWLLGSNFDLILVPRPVWSQIRYM